MTDVFGDFKRNGVSAWNLAKIMQVETLSWFETFDSDTRLSLDEILSLDRCIARLRASTYWAKIDNIHLFFANKTGGLNNVKDATQSALNPNAALIYTPKQGWIGATGAAQGLQFPVSRSRGNLVNSFNANSVSVFAYFNGPTYAPTDTPGNFAQFITENPQTDGRIQLYIKFNATSGNGLYGFMNGATGTTPPQQNVIKYDLANKGWIHSRRADVNGFTMQQHSAAGDGSIASFAVNGAIPTGGESNRFRLMPQPQGLTASTFPDRMAVFIVGGAATDAESLEVRQAIEACLKDFKAGAPGLV